MSTTNPETDTPKTEDVIASMLTENTGTHMLDSGGAYGRNWERMQGETVDSLKKAHPATLDTSWGGLSITLDLFHFLYDRLDYEPELQACFDRFAERPGNENEGWLTLMEAFPAFVAGLEGADVGGIYGDGKPFTVNTYNHESLLSQVIQYTMFYLDGSEDFDDGAYVLLQVHGGCDVRGGYTAPKVFSLADYDGTGIFDDARATVHCTDGRKAPVSDDQLDLDGKPAQNQCGAYWDTDDGYHFYPEGVAGPDHKELQEYDWVESDDLDDRQQGQITVVDGTAYCPCCGNGKLDVYGMSCG